MPIPKTLDCFSFSRRCLLLPLTCMGWKFLLLLVTQHIFYKANICWTIKKAREFQKNIYFCFTDFTKITKAFDCVDHNKLEYS